MFKRIQLKRFVFDLDFSREDPKLVTSCDFYVQGLLPAQMSEDDVREGYGYKQEIISGKYDWLIHKENMITLPTHNILVTLVDPIWDGYVRYGGGSITSNIKETCPHCKDTDCNFDCPESSKWQNIKDSMSSIQKRAESENYRHYNFACDTIEALVLGHAIAGVHIDSPAYLEGLESAIDATANKL